MISDQPPEAYVWIWLPRATEPVVAGRLEAADDILNFNDARATCAETTPSRSTFPSCRSDQA